ncbi:uncharacterized domain 1-containing protein [Jatrophihabitans endophyticus]|uniref:Uncharacterized domain 1-containing protein n=1 Tax=Jatrophihabitans endophyticus TaxID=1206085 RepID=A0A1M5BWE6_9ACTN|nr:PaaI family thioesterase [Jatrophihabitans endophyticus]SHF46868.1 uncharacterized domain 1-containing protein [Jatrophihabitans endophyticus]
MTDVREQLAATFDRGLNDALGFTLDVAEADRVVVSWTVGPHHLQPFGLVHGGVYASAVETAASVAGAIWLGDRGQVVGVSNQTDFLRACREGRLVATATPVHRGRSQQLWLVEITDADERLVARGQVRLQNLTD